MNGEIATGDGRKVRTLTDAEVEVAKGGVFEATLLGVTLQINADSAASPSGTARNSSAALV